MLFQDNVRGVYLAIATVRFIVCMDAFWWLSAFGRGVSPRLVLPMLIGLVARYSLCAHRLLGWGEIPVPCAFILCNASRGPDATVLSSHFFKIYA